MAVRTPRSSSRRKHARPKPKRRFPPEVLTDAEVRALIDACSSTSATGLRNRALLAILLPLRRPHYRGARSLPQGR